MPKNSDGLSRSTRVTLALMWVTTCFALLGIAAFAMQGGWG